VNVVELPRAADQVRARTFDALVDRPALDRAYRIARLIMLDPDDAEDATHDAVLSAWRRFGELRDPERFDAWFGRILVNACRDRLRSRRRGPISIEVAGVGILERGHGPDPGDALARSDLLRDAFRTLSPEHREVVALRFYLDLTVDQIAERTGSRAGTVKSRLHYALRRMREGIDEPQTRRADR
jgi:RNA polymerase sigma-70 factor (ECF subfamily)